MRDLRIVFMGTPDFAVATLEALVDHGHTIVGVITAPDRPAGRGQKLRMSAVKTYALQKSLLVLQPNNLKDPDFLQELKALEANLQIVVAFRMLPRAVWQLPQYGTFNLHASLLPDYRGAAPINWAIINGERKTGVTTFFIDDKIDTGEIIIQREIEINDEDTAGSLHDKLMRLGAQLVIETVGHIKDGTATTSKQPQSGQLKIAPKIFKETCEINWDNDIHSIHDHIRGLCPYPVAWTNLHNGDEKTSLKIYRTEKLLEKHDYPPGKILTTKKELKVAVKKGFLNLLEVQLQGRKRMKTTDLLNGLNLENNAYVG